MKSLVFFLYVWYNNGTEESSEIIIMAQQDLAFVLLTSVVVFLNQHPLPWLIKHPCRIQSQWKVLMSLLERESLREETKLDQSLSFSTNEPSSVFVCCLYCVFYSGDGTTPGCVCHYFLFKCNKLIPSFPAAIKCFQHNNIKNMVKQSIIPAASLFCYCSVSPNWKYFLYFGSQHRKHLVPDVKYSNLKLLGLSLPYQHI